MCNAGAAITYNRRWRAPPASETAAAGPATAPSGNGGFRSLATEAPRMSYSTKFTLGTIGIAALFAVALVLVFLS
jgi:hypothetical protein